MKTIKVSEATDIQIDWLVAKIKGGWILSLDSFLPNHRLRRMNFSTDWSQGGPILEWEGIDLYCNVPACGANGANGWDTSWRAKYHRCGVGSEMFYGPTPLIAAMRCYVASKLGENVEVPGELT
jgi:hypothetical protein